jgi:putative ABC transport system permease protein
MIRTAPWRRAPLLLLRAPGTALAVGGAGIVVAFVVASWPLFLQSVVDASHDRQVAQRCSWEVGATVVPPPPFGPTRPIAPDDLDRAVARLAPRIDHVGPPVRTAVATSIFGATADGGGRFVQLLARTGAADHVEILEGAETPGAALVPDLAYRELGLAPGDTLTLSTGSAEEPTTVTVAGSYRQLTAPLPEFWCSQASLLVPSGFGGDPPPPSLLVDQATIEDVSAALAVAPREIWEIPLDGTLTVDQAEAVAEGFDDLSHQLDARAVRSSLPFIVERSRAVADGLRGGLAPTVAAASAASAMLVVVAGWFWTERRRNELAVLRTLGCGPATIGLKAALELALPLVVGAAAGVAAAGAVVALVGPGGAPGAGAFRTATLAAACAAIGAVLVSAVVAGIRAARMERTGHIHRRWPAVAAAFPFELVVLVVASAALVRGGHDRPLAIGDAQLRVDPSAFLAPVVVVVAAGVLAGRLLRLALALVRRRSTRLPLAGWLGVRRLSARPGAPTIFSTCVAASVGVLVYAASISGSLQTSLEDKARLAVGADALVLTLAEPEVPAGFESVATTVARAGNVQRTQPQVVVLGVDPRGAAGVAARPPGVGAARFRALLDTLDVEPTPEAPVPAIVIGGPLPDDGVVQFSNYGALPLHLAPVAELDSFPGMSQAEPTVVVDLEVLRSYAIPHTEDVWVRGDPQPVVDALQASGAVVRDVRLPSQSLDTASFLAIVWTFDFVRSLGVLAAVVSAAGLLVYLDARQRSRQLAYGLSRRMGLSRAAHRRSLVVEVAAVVLGAAGAGALAGVVTGAGFVPRLDPLPRFAPATGLDVPTLGIVAAVVGAAVLCQVGATIGQRSADRVNLAEALRHGG